MTPKKAPALPREVSPVVGPIASSGIFSTRTFRADEEIDHTTAESMREVAAPGQTDVRLSGLVSGSAKKKATGNVTVTVPNPSLSAPDASSKKKRKRKNKSTASSTTSTPVPTPPSTPKQKPPAQQQSQLPQHHQPEVDHRLAPLFIPGRAPALSAQHQFHQMHPPSPPGPRSSAAPTGPSTGAIPKTKSNRERMKGLTWKQRQGVIEQRKVEKATANAAAGFVNASSKASMLAAATASAPRLPPSVPLPPYPVHHATVPAYLPQLHPSVHSALPGPYFQPWQQQPPAMQMASFGRPVFPAYPHPDQLLVDLSPPPGPSTIPQMLTTG